MALSEPMLVAGIVMMLTFLGVFTERFHGVERAKFAMAGAGAIILIGQYYGFYSPEAALQAVDWNVVFLLACMMIVVAIMSSTGGFERLAHHLAVMGDGSQVRLFLLVGGAVSAISMLLDNVTTVIIFSPLVVLICRTMQISPIPYLMGMAILSNSGGVATLVGDPPNLMIGSAAGINFSTFLIYLGPVALLAWASGLGALLWQFRTDLSQTVHQQFDRVVAYRNRRLWRRSLWVMVMMVVLFVVHHHIGWEPWMVAAFSLTMMLFLSRKVELEKVTNHLETPLLIFFISLFILIGGIEKSGLLAALGREFTPLILEHPQLAALLILWVAALLSALIDNIPFTAAMIPVLLSLQEQHVDVSVLWWALALGVGLGGNGSHIGSTANVYVVTVSERLAKDTNRPELAITPGIWLRKGLPVMLISLLMCSLILWFGYDLLSPTTHSLK